MNIHPKYIKFHRQNYITIFYLLVNFEHILLCRLKKNKDVIVNFLYLFIKIFVFENNMKKIHQFVNIEAKI